MLCDKKRKGHYWRFYKFQILIQLSIYLSSITRPNGQWLVLMGKDHFKISSKGQILQLTEKHYFKWSANKKFVWECIQRQWFIKLVFDFPCSQVEPRGSDKPATQTSVSAKVIRWWYRYVLSDQCKSRQVRATELGTRQTTGDMTRTINKSVTITCHLNNWNYVVDRQRYYCIQRFWITWMLVYFLCDFANLVTLLSIYPSDDKKRRC